MHGLMAWTVEECNAPANLQVKLERCTAVYTPARAQSTLTELSNLNAAKIRQKVPHRELKLVSEPDVPTLHMYTSTFGPGAEEDETHHHTDLF